MVWFWIALISALLSAAAAILQKKILAGLGAPDFSFLVSIMIAGISLAVPLIADVTAISLQTLIIVTAKSVIGGSAFLFVMMALERVQISQALPLLGLTPGVAAIVSLLVVGDSLRPWEWGGVALMMIGTAVLEGFPNARSPFSLRGMVASPGQRFILAALGCFALSAVADKVLVSRYNVEPLVILFYQHLVYAALFALLLLVRRRSWRQVMVDARGVIPLIIAVAVLTVGYRLLQLEATKLTSVALVLAVKRTSILFASLLGGKLFSDDKLSRRMVGAVLIVAAGFIILRNIA
jgi:uncharacterized membrane protein